MAPANVDDNDVDMEVEAMHSLELSGKNSGRDSEDNNDEYEYEYEEYYVVAALPPDALDRAREAATQPSNSDISQTEAASAPKYALVDVGSSRPFLELEGTIYQGTRDELLGTSLAFAYETTDANGAEQKTCIDLVGTTLRVIAFSPVSILKR
ncbi:hypothetical protein EV174_003992 [Coemansia sp. RSA 2320]|nr:hypothetical protein EV174_003992 [Coemansia sp. RSA 2320]